MSDISLKEDDLQRIALLQKKIENYRPGSTIRLEEKRPKRPPRQTRIGLFGGPGVGKSALINSFLYATGDMWTHMAPEGYQSQAAMTMSRHAYDISSGLTVCDNRGMKDFSRKYMSEVDAQLAGARRDGADVVWDKTIISKLAGAFERVFLAEEAQRIHCAVLVLSAQNLSVQPSDMKQLIATIKRVTGYPPIVVITHKNCTSDANALSSYQKALKDVGIMYVFVVENYTFTDFRYDSDRHLAALEVLYQCMIEADKIMQVLLTDEPEEEERTNTGEKKKEEKGWCSIQ
ncbi:uncharacterized protein [Diadema antillarum]|uniref:uncharacterized protein n=1 Tax=Diadema antillarum TaxID=105358 RepID=UPI003A874AB0